MFAYQILVMVAAANPLDPPEISNEVKTVFYGVFGIMLLGMTVLGFVKLVQDVFFKRSAATVKFEAHSESQPKDKEPGHQVLDISGFVAAKDFEQHKGEAERRARGLEEQISKLRHDWGEEIQPLLSRIEARDEITQEWRAEIVEKVDKSALKLAATEREMTIIARTQDNIDKKLDRLIERHIPALPAPRS